jgi:hypothetical protein
LKRISRSELHRVKPGVVAQQLESERVTRERMRSVVVALLVEPTRPGKEQKTSGHGGAPDVLSHGVKHGETVVLRIHDPEVAVRPQINPHRLRELARTAPLPRDRADIVSGRAEDTQVLRLPIEYPNPAGRINFQPGDVAEHGGGISIDRPDPQLLHDLPVFAGSPERNGWVRCDDLA